MNKLEYSAFSDPFSICNDAVFKAIFTKETAESRTALRSLLSAFLEKDLSILKVTANEPPINDIRDRQIRFDISVRFNGGELANVEMTLHPKQYESLRFEYYTARLFVNQSIRGRNRTYGNLKSTYHLSFLARNLYPDREWLHRFIYYDPDRGIKMGGRTEIMTVELKKLQGITEKAVEQLDKREVWAFFMMYYREDKKTGIIQKIIDMDDGIAAADQVIQGFTESELEGLAAIAKDKFEFDAREELWEMKQAARAEGLAEGLAEGKVKGLAEGKVNGLAEGKLEGLAEGKIEGHAIGKAEGFSEGKIEGHAIGKAEGLTIGKAEERQIWQNVVADKDAEIARLRKQLEV